jgi:transposase
MFTVELYAGIRRAVMIDGLSRREAAKRFGVHRNTITKMLQFSVPPGYRRRERPASKKLGPHMAWIDKVLEDDRSVPKKQRHTAHRIFERLRDEEGFSGGYTIVREYVAQAMLLRFPVQPVFTTSSAACASSRFSRAILSALIVSARMPMQPIYLLDRALCVVLVDKMLPEPPKLIPEQFESGFSNSLGFNNYMFVHFSLLLFERADSEIESQGSQCLILAILCRTTAPKRQGLHGTPHPARHNPRVGIMRQFMTEGRIIRFCWCTGWRPYEGFTRGKLNAVR